MNINPTIVNILRYALFWSWNLIFTLLFIFLLAKEVTGPILKEAYYGWIPASYAIYSIGLCLIPFAAIIIGVLPRYRKNSKLLLKLFYVVEIPLFFLCLARLIIFNEMMSATQQLVLVYLIAIIAYAITLLKKDETATNDSPRQEWIAYANLIAAALGLLIAFYIALLCVFYVPPLAKYTISEFFQFHWAHHLFNHPLELLLFLFALFTATLFIALPISIIYFHTRHIIDTWRDASSVMTTPRKWQIVGSAIIINVFVFILVNSQQQQAVFKQYGETAQLDNQAKETIIENADSIRASLLNAYLAEYRYAGSTEKNNLLNYLYHDAFGLSDSGAAAKIQSIYNALASPFIYKGDEIEDKQKAKELYRSLFDSDIERAERESIQSTLRTNWRRQGIEAGIVDIDRERVLITQQELNVHEYTHSAEITLSETYLNQTYSEQEILYYFSLPEHTVLTGLWLSDDRDNPEKFAYQIAPRGAAQRVYKKQLERRRDPALLEQVGPQQYRLRIFPLRAKRYQDMDNDHPDQRLLYMKLRFAQALATDGNWHMPRLLERRNVYWNDESTLSINGLKRRRDDNWLPKQLAAKNAKPLREAVFWQEPDMRIIKEAKNSEKLALDPIRLAILVDTSFSMHKHRDDLLMQLNNINNFIQHREISARFYCVQQHQREAFLPVSKRRLPKLELQAFDESKALLKTCQYFGSTGNVASLASLQTNNLKGFDAVIFFTDDGAFDSHEHTHWKLNADIPIWLIHIDHALPYAYDDRLLDAVQLSGGGVSDQFETAYSSLLIFAKNGFKGRLSDSALWLFQKESQPFESSHDDPALKAVAAQQYILYQYQQKGNALAELDNLHRLAAQHSIVTPFSSMIVLVNDEQKNDLAKASQSANRFQRNENIPSPIRRAPGNPFSVTAVPEPEEWALIICLLMLLGAAAIHRRRQLLNYE